MNDSNPEEKKKAAGRAACTVHPDPLDAQTLNQCIIVTRANNIDETGRRQVTRSLLYIYHISLFCAFLLSFLFLSFLIPFQDKYPMLSDYRVV